MNAAQKRTAAEAIIQSLDRGDRSRAAEYFVQHMERGMQDQEIIDLARYAEVLGWSWYRTTQHYVMQLIDTYSEAKLEAML